MDPSAGVIADVQNTIVNNAILHWATPAQKKKYLPRLAGDTVASYALSEAGSGSDAFALALNADASDAANGVPFRNPRAFGLKCRFDGVGSGGSTAPR